MNKEKLIDEARRKLWRNRRRARAVNGIAGCDLIVDDVYRTKVWPARTFNGLTVRTQDCHLVIAITPDGEQRYARPEPSMDREGQGLFTKWGTLTEALGPKRP